MLDGHIAHHKGPKITDYWLPSRITFSPVNKLVCGCCRKDKKSKIEHDDLWSFPGEDVPSVWKLFKPNWDAELNEEQYESYHTDSNILFRTDLLGSSSQTKFVSCFAPLFLAHFPQGLHPPNDLRCNNIHGPSSDAVHAIFLGRQAHA